MTDRIRVSGFRRPISVREQRQYAQPVPAIRLFNLVGPLIAVTAIVSVLAWGTPHMLLFTRSSGFGSYRFYDDCAYASLDGRVVHLRGYACPLFRLLREGR